MSDLAGLRVLVVEDEYLLARQLERALAREGAVVTAVAPTIVAALAALEAPPLPDVAVLDLNLAGEKAYAVADRLRAARVPFLVASGYDSAERDPALAEAPHLAKPLTMATLVRALAALTGRASA